MVTRVCLYYLLFTIYSCLDATPYSGYTQASRAVSDSPARAMSQFTVCVPVRETLPTAERSVRALYQPGSKPGRCSTPPIIPRYTIFSDMAPRARPHHRPPRPVPPSAPAPRPEGSYHNYRVSNWITSCSVQTRASAGCTRRFSASVACLASLFETIAVGRRMARK